MRWFLIAVVVCVSAVRAEAGFPETVPMDGPVTDACAARVSPAADLAAACRVLTTKRVGGVRVQVIVVGYATEVTLGIGAYYVAVQHDQGWLVSHDPLDVVAGWKEHGPTYAMAPRAPRLVALKLASKRHAFAFDLPIHVTVSHCNDQGLEDKPAHCGPQPVEGSPVAMFACGEAADGTWACLPPNSSATVYRATPRFRADGTVRPGDEGTNGFFNYDITATDRVAF